MTKLHKTILSRIDKAVHEYNMFANNDRVLMGVSGGADSMALFDLLAMHIWHYADAIDLKAVYIDLGYSNGAEDRCRTMQDFWDRLRVDGIIERTDIGPYSQSDANRENPCFLCSRIRRKKIFEAAETLGCNKIVFGHHKQDITETLIMNMIFGREISTMPPKLKVFQGKYHILRPLLYVEEDLIKKYRWERNLPLIDQECPTDGHSKRQYIKDLLQTLEEDFKGAGENIFNSMKRVKQDYLL